MENKECPNCKHTYNISSFPDQYDIENSERVIVFSKTPGECWECIHNHYEDWKR